MARRTKTKNAKGKGKPPIRLNEHLILAGYLHSLFGKTIFEEMQTRLHEVQEGYDEEGRSYLFHALFSWDGLDPRVQVNLETYDTRIRGYLERINRHRDTPVTLTYFQLLAVLYTEIFLDRYFQSPQRLLDELNEYAYEFIEKRHLSMNFLFNEDDLRKLAFWMATGSGKTLILSINYLQFMHYNAGPNQINLDNILLITPNESLTNQHLAELAKSSIPAEAFQPRGGLFATTTSPTVVQVIDINKLTEEKKGQGVSVDIASFDTKNLVFVDEGHKGSGGTSWMDLRKKIAADGFTFEYSATFGQAVASAGKKIEGNELLTGYGKSIIFDYSYRYFYRDGYGKDYRLLNVKDAKFDQKTKQIVMLANLLTFYQQKRIHEENPELAKEYNIEAPLWIFVGSRVKGKTGESDLLEVVRFLSSVLNNEHGWTVSTIRSIFEGKSGLLDRTTGRDLFSPSFPEQKLAYLKSKKVTPEEAFADILSRVFHAPASAPLHLVNLKTAAGEIALRCGNENQYFGVINIGEDTEFIKLVEEKEPKVRSDKDELTPSLFNSIKERTSPVNILIGARKFIEGWDTWRVSTMGLLNIGKSEGTQIIQLFGRGVRLKGKDKKLKRSSAIEDITPPHTPMLETLNIFGIEANYLEQFRQYLIEEGIEDSTYIDIPLPIHINDDYLKEGLLIPHVDKRRFRKEKLFSLAMDDQIIADVDLMPKVDIEDSLRAGNYGLEAESGSPDRYVNPAYIEALDWNRIYFSLLDTKIQKNWYNFIFGMEDLKKVIQQKRYRLKCLEYFIAPRQYEQMRLVEDVTIAILRKYLQKYYDKKRNRWTQDHLTMKILDKDHGNFDFTYHIRVNEQEKEIITQIEKLIKTDLDSLCKGSGNLHLINAFFSRHLYQPLLMRYGDEDIIKIQPEGLNEGERKFINDLKKHVEQNQDLFADKKVFVLRNLPKKGVGFFESVNFYPDFIVWIVAGDSMQHILFVEPHSTAFAGIESERELQKMKFGREIKNYEERLKQRCPEHKFTLDSFIVDVTHREYLGAVKEKQHIYGQDSEGGYIEKIIQGIISS
jgi:hypothetical protein